MNLDGIKIAVVGGDAREMILVQALLETGAELLLVGYPEIQGATVVDLETALATADCIILPMSNTDPEGALVAVPTGEKIQLSADLLQLAKPGTPFLLGMAKPKVKAWVQEAKLNLVELGELDELAILNAVPTAEGAVQLAMEKLPITIHGARCAVLGFGRCGTALARLLSAMGAETTVVARRPSQLALAKTWGLAACELGGLEKEIGSFDLIYNTIPALVLTEQLLQKTKEDVLIIDLASSPGGVDFSAAKELGREAILALGLPGKVAPVTAGKILGEVVPSLLLGLVQSRA